MAQIALGVLTARTRAFNAEHAGAFTGHCGQRQGEQAGTEYKSQITASAADCSCPLTEFDHVRTEAIGAWRCTCQKPLAST